MSRRSRLDCIQKYAVAKEILKSRSTSPDGLKIFFGCVFKSSKSPPPIDYFIVLRISVNFNKNIKSKGYHNKNFLEKTSISQKQTNYSHFSYFLEPYDDVIHYSRVSNKHPGTFMYLREKFSRQALA